jgi:hypothetical protein
MDTTIHFSWSSVLNTLIVLQSSKSFSTLACALIITNLQSEVINKPQVASVKASVSLIFFIAPLTVHQHPSTFDDYLLWLVNFINLWFWLQGSSACCDNKNHIWDCCFWEHPKSCQWREWKQPGPAYRGLIVWFFNFICLLHCIGLSSEIYVKSSLILLNFVCWVNKSNVFKDEKQYKFQIIIVDTFDPFLKNIFPALH